MEYRIVFDGPPSHDMPRFVEVEDENGNSINAGEWRPRADGLYELVIKIIDPWDRVEKWDEQPLA